MNLRIFHLNILVDNLKDCVLEIINSIKEENVLNLIDQIKDNSSIYFIL